MEEFKQRLLALQEEFRPCKFSERDTAGWWRCQKYYVDSYAAELYPKANDIKKVLEIGIQKGGSLKMWEQLFPGAVIHGVDISSTCASAAGENRIVHIGDQSDRSFLESEVIPHGPFDLIIDDGGHWSSQQLASLGALWPHVAPGGIYLIEDLGMNYRWPNNKDCVEYLRLSIDSVNAVYGVKPLINDLFAIKFYSGLCWLHKHFSTSSQGV